MLNKELKSRIIDITYKNKLSHLGSCLTAVDIINEIYEIKNEDDKFILSSGHAGLALYVVLEKYFGIDAQDLLHRYGIHPCKDLENKIICSTGSLGQGITVAVGHAIANQDKMIYVLCSDGEAAEGSFMESMRFLSENPQINNIKIYINFNGFGAYKNVSLQNLKYQTFDLVERGIVEIVDTTGVLDDYKEVLGGLSAHYKTLTESDYNTLCSI